MTRSLSRGHHPGRWAAVLSLLPQPKRPAWRANGPPKPQAHSYRPPCGCPCQGSRPAVCRSTPTARPAGSGGACPEHTPSRQAARHPHPGRLFQPPTKTRHGVTESQNSQVTTGGSQRTERWPHAQGTGRCLKTYPFQQSHGAPRRNQGMGYVPHLRSHSQELHAPLHTSPPPHLSQETQRGCFWTLSLQDQSPDYPSTWELSPWPYRLQRGDRRRKGIAQKPSAPGKGRLAALTAGRDHGKQTFPQGHCSGLTQAAAPTFTRGTPAPHCIPGLPNRNPIRCLC